MSEGVTGFSLNATSSTSIRVTWSPPTCPYGNITEYTVSFREADVARTINIESDGFISRRVPSDSGRNMYQYNILDLDAYTNYTVHIQAIATPFLRTGRSPIGGRITQELLKRTLSAPDPDIPSPSPTLEPITTLTITGIVAFVSLSLSSVLCLHQALH